MALALNNIEKFDMPLNKETKTNLIHNEFKITAPDRKVIYIYIYVGVCVSVCVRESTRTCV